MGALRGSRRRQVILRVLHLTHGAWLVNGELRRAGHISRRDMWARRLRAMTAGARGAWDGLGRRRLLPAGSQQAQQSAAGRIQPFLRPQSLEAPSVDPIDGSTGEGPLARPPLRIGLLARPFVASGPSLAADELATMTRALFDMGHVVHVLTTAEERTIVFLNGAFIHAELLPAGPDTLLAGVRRLIENDGVQWLVGASDDLAAVTAAQLAPAAAAVPAPPAVQPAGSRLPVPDFPAAGDVHMLPESVQDILQPLLVSGYALAATGQEPDPQWSRP